MRRYALVPSALTLALLASCSSNDRSCSVDEEKAEVLRVAESWYLFPEYLDAGIDPAPYADTQAYLDALTAPARAATLDKGWNFMTTAVAAQRLYGDGEAIGFGVGLLVRGSQLFVSHAYPGSAAADVGFQRGDEILKIGETPDALVPVDLATPGALSAALGPSSTAGVTRSFEVMPRGSSTSVVRTLTTRVFSLSPVSDAVIDLGATGGPKVGYLVLRTFVSTANADLVAAMADFQAQGVTDVVVDLRYNGGGLVSTAVLLGDLLSASHPGEVMYTLRNNPTHVSYDEVTTFEPPAQAIQPARVAFVTTGATASASELVANALEPYLASDPLAPQIALVGSRTYGKPVGQRAWEIGTCGSLLYLVSFQLENKDGEGGYFSGLPDTTVPPAFAGPLCPADDDLGHDEGDQAEASTAAALYFLQNGTCPPPPAGAQALRMSRPADAYPAPVRPSIAQIENPGLF